MDYEQELKQKVEAAQKRVEAGIAAGKFNQTAEGKLVQDWINERVSYLLNKMTARTPLSRDEYLSYHGAVNELQGFNSMLQIKQQALPSAQEEMKALNEQQAAISGQEPIDF